MKNSPLTQPEASSLGSDLLYAFRYYLSGRRGLIAAIIVLGIPALWVGWPWLVVAGIAPILIALAPCAIMCDLGLCMSRMTGRTCSSNSTEDSDPSVTGAISSPKTDQRQQSDHNVKNNRPQD